MPRNSPPLTMALAAIALLWPAAPRAQTGDPAISASLTTPAHEPRLSQPQLIAALRRRVKYVFVIYQENRSFDSYFGTFPGADGLFSKPAAQTPGFNEALIGTDGVPGTIHPFRIGPKEFAADTDDIDHSHALLVAKMDVANGAPRMDRFAVTEERKYSPAGNPSLAAKQFGELAMAYEDCDTVPFLWRYANRFVLFDRVFQTMTGPSTPGNLAIIAAQTGDTQWALHPDEAYKGNGNSGPGEPVENDSDPLSGSPKDTSAHKLPVSPADYTGAHPYGVQINQTYASLPLTLAGRGIGAVSKADADPADDLADIGRDIPAIVHAGHAGVGWDWYEEGFDHEPTDPAATDPTDANGLHASYIAHHNGPQYFGYVANNPKMAAHLKGLGDFFGDVEDGKLPPGGLFYVKGGYRNIAGLKPADPDPKVQKAFLGDDDHPAYSDAQISQALVARAVNAIAASKYWAQSAIVITWDDSEGDYDHVPPPIRHHGPDGSVTGDGPRVPLIVISPYARAHTISHVQGSQASVVKFADTLFGLPPLASLPDERAGVAAGLARLHQAGLGPDDSRTDVGDLTAAFDPARLTGKAAPLPASYATIPAATVAALPQSSGFGCKAIGIVPTDYAQGVANDVPADFNPRPHTLPTDVAAAPATKP